MTKANTTHLIHDCDSGYLFFFPERCAHKNIYDFVKQKVKINPAKRKMRNVVVCVRFSLVSTTRKFF